MTALSLFSGIGAHDLGLQMAGLTIAGQVELDPYCCAVLEQHWPNVPRWNDVRTVTGADVSRRCGRIDLITGSFPCQDISAAGKGAGLHGDRSSLFFEIARLAGEIRPTWLLLENVPALRSRGADRVLAELDGLGYARWPCVVGAWAVGAPHKRDRVWIVGHRMAQPDERAAGDRGVFGEPDDAGGRPVAAGRAGLQQGREAGGGRPWTPSVDGGELAQSVCGRLEGCAVSAGPRHEGHGEARVTGASDSRARSDRAVVAHPAQRGQRADGGARGGDGHADQQGAAGLADRSSAGLAERVVQPGVSGRAERADQGQDAGVGGVEYASGPGLRASGQSEPWWPDERCQSLRWPARPGEEQEPWEDDRLFVFDVGRNFARFAQWMDGLTVGPDGTWVLRDATTYQTRTGTLLQTLQWTPSSQEVPEAQPDRADGCVPPQDVLRQGLRGVGEADVSGELVARWTPASCRAGSSNNRPVPDVRVGVETASASSQRKSGGQRTAEHPDPLQLLPHEVALEPYLGWQAQGDEAVRGLRDACKGQGSVQQALSAVLAAWRSAFDGDQRAWLHAEVGPSLERRMRRDNRNALKAIGNCNPPHVPYLIGRWLMAQEKDG